MSTKYIERRHDAAKVATGSHAGVGVEYSTNKIYVKPSPDVDRLELVDTSTAQTLTNKTFTSPVISNPIVSAGSIILEGTTDDAFETTIAAEATGSDKTVTLPDATDTLVGKATTDTLTNKSVSLATNTLTGTIAQFNTAVSDADLATLAGSESLTNKTLTAPVLTAPTGTGFLRTARVDFVEDATSVSHTASVPIPAGAVLHSIFIYPSVVWGDASAALDIGDTADPNGYIAAALLDGTDIEAINPAILPFDVALITTNSKLGAYFFAPNDNSLVGPASGNFGWNYVAGSNLIITVNVATPSATTGRTTVVVYYTVPATVTPVLA